jgi:diketogulonate reductase-like aldo/keto reductase
VNQVTHHALARKREPISHFLQINLHPYNYASWRDVLEFSAKHGIVIEAYGSLAWVIHLSHSFNAWDSNHY